MGTSKQPRQGRTAAIEAIENATALMITLQDLTEQISEHSLSISAMATQGEQAIERANVRLAAVIFGDVHQASRHQRELLARMQMVAASARVHLATAREYGTGEG
jgi:hypothetical protein